MMLRHRPDRDGGRPLSSLASALEAVVAWARRHPRWFAVLQVAIFVAFAVAVGLALRGGLEKAGHRLADADLVDFGIGCAAVAAYYLVFVLGWIRILRAWGVDISYGVSLRSEMVSMLAKYVPGGIWTPAARVVALRRAGVTDAGLVTAAMLVEAGISAVAGIVVFVASLTFVQGVDAPLWPLVGFGVLLVVLLHPRVFRPLASRVLKRLGGRELPELPTSTLLGLGVFYCMTWLIGGVGLYFFVRAVDGRPALNSIVFLGGVSAVGAIVAVVSFFAPSGLGPREASMYGLMVAIVPHDAALGATVLNRAAITLIEILLLLFGGFGSRLLASREVGRSARIAPAEAGPEE
jgi:uncharacterized membrane protein YbhN (UPF0104 family)